LAKDENGERFEVFTAKSFQILLFRVVTLGDDVLGYEHFVGTCGLHLHSDYVVSGRILLRVVNVLHRAEVLSMKEESHCLCLTPTQALQTTSAVGIYYIRNYLLMTCYSGVLCRHF